MVCNSLQDVLQLRNAFQPNSPPNFTYEVRGNNTISFLDVHIERMANSYKISVFKKPTDTGVYLNASSECPARYKESTVKALIHRTYKVSSDWNVFNSSIDTLKQTFINNGYSNTTFDRLLRAYLDKVHRREATNEDRVKHDIYK